MPRARTQLNINIDPALLAELKSEAIKNGKTLTDLVTEKLRVKTEEYSEKLFESRIMRIEKLLMLDKKSSIKGKDIGSIFTDQGAKEYSEVAKSEFQSHAVKKGLTVKAALIEIDYHLKNYAHSNHELIFQILMGNHQLTGLEMTIAHRHGYCAMRAALADWANDPLEKLNKAYINAVIEKSLA